MQETRTIGLPRRALSVAAALGLATTGTIMIASVSQGAQQKNDTPKKVFVCKYVGKPGVDERLQTGQNPIQVSVNAIKGPGPVQPGYEFADRHGRSLVIAFVTDKKNEPEPECPVPTPPKTTPPGKTTPPDTPGKAKPKPSKGKAHVTPGVGAPDTGGAGDIPVNGLIGSGLLLAAGGILARDAVLRRRVKVTKN